MVALYKPTGIYNQDLLLVKDLFVQDRRQWNDPLITHIFPPAIAQHILSIPLSLAGEEDSFFWPHAEDGIYSCKTGYGFLKQNQQRRAASTSAPVTQMPPAIWKEIVEL